MEIDVGKMSLNEEEKLNEWAEHYERLGLLNVEFKWDHEHLSDKPQLKGQHIPVTIDMLKKAISGERAC